MPDDLYDYIHEPTQRRSPSLRIVNIENLPVVDDWPERVPITEAEIQVFERWFGDVFDELLNPKTPEDRLRILSQTDRKEA